MSVYGGIQLPKINEDSMDDRKERKQIMNYLALLDEKLRYMFQNIDIEENLSQESQDLFFKYGEDIRNVIKDTEGNFSMFEQTIDGIRTAVQDVEGNVSLLQQTAEGLATSVSNASGQISQLTQRADGIETTVANLGGSVSTLTQTAEGLSSTVKSLQDEVAQNASSITQTATQIRSEVSQQVTSLNNSIDSLDDDIYDLTDEVDDVRSIAEQAADHFSWIVESGTSASRMTLTDEFLEIIADEVVIDADVRLYGEMKLYESDSGTTYGGWLSYGEGDNGSSSSSTGVMLSSKDQYSYFIATNTGVRMTYDDEYAVYCTSAGVTLAGDYDFRAATNLYCMSDDSACLGTSNRRWDIVYATTGTINTSDEREKSSISYDMTEHEKLFNLLKPTPYKMNSGTSDRLHVGFIAQDVEGAMEEIGMDSKDFAGFVKSPVYARELESGEFDTSSEVIDYRYALRYGEFVALNTHMIQKLMARVSELENKLEALS